MAGEGVIIRRGGTAEEVCLCGYDGIHHVHILKYYLVIKKPLYQQPPEWREVTACTDLSVPCVCDCSQSRIGKDALKMSTVES